MKTHRDLDISDYAKMHGRIIEMANNLNISPSAAAEGLRLSFKEYYSPNALLALLRRAQAVFNCYQSSIATEP